MTTTHPDFPRIQQRLHALGLYDHPIDNEWGPGMSSGIDQALTMLERDHPVLHPSVEAAPIVQDLSRLPAGYGWIGQIGPLPRHMAFAISLIGTLESPGEANNPVILDWAKQCAAAGLNVSGYTADSVAWCGLFVAFVMLKTDRQPVSSPLWALNWAAYGQPAGQPEFGDVLTFTRAGGGHVAFYVAEDTGFYHVLGGNQSDRVNIMRIDKSRMHSCRQPAYKTKPACVKPYIVAPSGVISRNES